LVLETNSSFDSGKLEESRNNGESGAVERVDMVQAASMSCIEQCLQALASMHPMLTQNLLFSVSVLLRLILIDK